MAKYLVCVSDERHASYEIERAILEKAGAELKLCHCESAADIAAQCADADAVLLDLAPMTAEAVAGSSAATVSVLRMSIWMRRPPQAFRSPMFPITAWRMFPTMRWR